MCLKSELVSLFFSSAVIIEKLLRTCDIESIYVLIRAKKNDDIHTRLGKIFDDSVRIIWNQNFDLTLDCESISINLPSSWFYFLAI